MGNITKNQPNDWLSYNFIFWLLLGLEEVEFHEPPILVFVLINSILALGMQHGFAAIGAAPGAAQTVQHHHHAVLVPVPHFT
jgi:hypothetical protein